MHDGRARRRRIARAACRSATARGRHSPSPRSMRAHPRRLAAAEIAAQPERPAAKHARRAARARNRPRAQRTPAPSRARRLARIRPCSQDAASGRRRACRARRPSPPRRPPSACSSTPPRARLLEVAASAPATTPSVPASTSPVPPSPCPGCRGRRRASGASPRRRRDERVRSFQYGDRAIRAPRARALPRPDRAAPLRRSRRRAAARLRPGAASAASRRALRRSRASRFSAVRVDDQRQVARSSTRATAPCAHADRPSPGPSTTPSDRSR